MSVIPADILHYHIVEDQWPVAMWCVYPGNDEIPPRWIVCGLYDAQQHLKVETRWPYDGNIYLVNVKPITRRAFLPQQFHVESRERAIDESFLKIIRMGCNQRR